MLTFVLLLLLFAFTKKRGEVKEGKVSARADELGPKGGGGMGRERTGESHLRVLPSDVLAVARRVRRIRTKVNLF